MKITALLPLMARLTMAIAVSAAPLAYAQSAPTPPAEKPGMTMPMAKSMMQPTDMARSMDRMHEKMTSMSMTGDPDQDFAMMMKIHHEGAVEMAQAELAHGKDPVMRSAAKKIIVAQRREIAEFDRWMTKHATMAGASQIK